MPVGIPAKTRDHRVVRRLAAALGSVLVGAVLDLGCSHPGVFRCESNDQCQAGEQPGVCTDAGYCAFEDESCASGLEYGALAEPDLAGTCVPVGSGTEVSGEPSSDATSSSSSASDEPPVTGDETGHEVVCPAGVGGPCEPADPCALEGICEADGSCTPTGIITCNAPPGPCYSPLGMCKPEGGCLYEPLQQTECEDGDPCTVGDLCDGMGTCLPGAVCPSDDPCQPSVCMAEGCVVIALEDGAACGMFASKRCCNGACVDISIDPDHCGGCNAACAMGATCESVEVTAMCQDAPADTTGRCRCQMADDECPPGQLCRSESPYAGRCAPTSSMGCDGDFVEVDLCPNYCSY